MNRLSARMVAARAAMRVVAGLVAIGVLYATVPIDTDTTVGALAIMAIATMVFVAIIAHNLRTLRRSAHPVVHAIRFLILTLALFVTGFAATYLAIYQADPNSFSEPLTKISSLYFTVTVLATVGFGDITATTEAARIVVTAQMVSGFTLLVVLARYVMHVASRRAATVGSSMANPGEEPAATTGNPPEPRPGE